MIVRAGVLGGKNARAGQTAENAQVEHEEKLIDNRNRRHLERADAPNHHVVQQADDIGYRVLNDNRHDDGDHLRVKRPIAKHSFEQLCAANFFCSHVYKTAFPRRKPMKAMPLLSGAAGCLLIVSKPKSVKTQFTYRLHCNEKRRFRQFENRRICAAGGRSSA